MRSQEEERALKGVQEEWEVELTKLTAKFEKDLQTKARNKEDQKVLTLKYAKEKDKFEKNMTLKREKKKESVTKRLLEHERAAAAALVEKHSEEMMKLISALFPPSIFDEDLGWGGCAARSMRTGSLWPLFGLARATYFASG